MRCAIPTAVLMMGCVCASAQTFSNVVSMARQNLLGPSCVIETNGVLVEIDGAVSHTMNVGNTNDAATLRLYRFLLYSKRGFQGKYAQDCEKAYYDMRRLVEDAPGSWQGELAKCMLATKGSEMADFTTAVREISKVLEELDFDLLERTRDADFNTMRDATWGEYGSLRDVLNFALANAYCGLGELANAERIVERIKSPAGKALMLKGIQIQREWNAERAAKEKLKREKTTEEDKDRPKL